MAFQTTADDRTNDRLKGRGNRSIGRIIFSTPKIWSKS
jgi:hypothetical protein